MKRGLGWYRIRGRSRTALLVSLAVHVGVVVALINVVFRYDIGSLGVAERAHSASPERVRYVRLVAEPSAGGPATATRPAPGPTATRRLQSPRRVPVGIRQPSSPAAVAQPAYTDPRLWPQPGPFTPLPKTTAERTDSAVKAAFGIFVDSMRTAEANRGRAPGDWTFKDKNGGKWGWDPSGIRLGKVTIPQAVLALLPLNVQANPTFNDPVTRRESAFHARDIAYHSYRAVSDDEFRRAVRRIRER